MVLSNMETSYHMILPCIRENDTDPVNKIENFETELPEEFELNDDWELGLTEITYPRIWCTLPSNQKIEILKFRNSPEYINCIPDNYDDPKYKKFIEKGDYTINELIKKCNEVITSLFEHDSEGKLRIINHNENEVTTIPELSIDLHNNQKIKQRVGCLDNKQRFFLRFEEELANILGIGYHETTHLADTVFGKYYKLLQKNPEHVFKECGQDQSIYEYGFRDFNIDRNLEYMYITCDAIKDSYFENIKSDLLRVIKIPENSYYGQQITEIFENPYYYPLKKNIFGKIRIKIFQKLPEKSLHDLLPFTFGKILVHLHLRKCEKIVRPILEPEQVSPDVNHEVEEKEIESENPHRNKFNDGVNKGTPIITDRSKKPDLTAKINVDEIIEDNKPLESEESLKKPAVIDLLHHKFIKPNR